MQFGSSITDIELNPYKFVSILPKLEALAAGQDIFPVTVELDPVNYCNHKCRWCVDPYHGQSCISLNFAERLFGEFEEIGVAGVVFKGGGEPTLHPEFSRLLETASKCKFEVGVVTNGSRINGIADVLASYADYVRVSIDGPTPSSHRYVHGSDDFEHVVGGAKKLLEIRNKSNQRHPIVGLSFAMDFGMIDLVDAALKLGEQVKSDYILFRPPFFEEVGAQATNSPLESFKLRKQFVDAANGYTGDMKILVDHWISDQDAKYLNAYKGNSPRRGSYIMKNANGIEHVTGRCLASPLLSVITAEGDVYPCCNLRSIQKWRIGRINYEQGRTLKMILEGQERQEILTRIKKFACAKHCTHPLSKYNEIIEYLKSPMHHKGFV
ncbi:radical SAM protein [Desulfatibacillum aliphaticivorans]|uniref:radical SAM protein n=1 Tax=Desulfatibacillum aliphaticivorans TaxID=218208 RepID=UPI00041C76B3|nr:radical SAM protein [Desulfatibacillum aliphaticivorans]